MTENEKTELRHWEAAWSVRPRLSFPSGLDIGTRNVFRLLRRYLKPGIRYLEVGCAPGKILSWVAREIQAPVCGIDYSPVGVETAKWLCDGLKLHSDIRCEDAMSTSFQAEQFDLVFSCGLIEHFENPAPMVAAHVRLLAPGGTAVIAVPNYSGIYLKLQSWCDAENLAIHNLHIMNDREMAALAPQASDLTSQAFYFGRLSPWLISLSAKFGRAGQAISWLLNIAAFLQPADIKALTPLVVLEVKRSLQLREQ